MAPYPIQYDTVFNRFLSVINAPDSVGLNCNLQMFSIPIGAGKLTSGLPNEPNYNLGTMECNVGVDDLTGDKEYKMNISPNPTSGLMRISLNKNIIEGVVDIYNVLGVKVYSEAFNGNLKKVNCNFCAGVYFVRVMASSEIMNARFIKE